MAHSVRESLSGGKDRNAYQGFLLKPIRVAKIRREEIFSYHRIIE